jgi:ABC-2 type transport system permease protein
MISTILRVSLLYLLRDRVALALTFLLPLVFFSVFAAVFAPMDSATVRAVKTVIVVDPASAFAARVAERLARKEGLEVVRRGPAEREEALGAVRTGKADVVLILPARFEVTRLGGGEGSAGAELYVDRSNPLAVDLVRGLLQRSVAEVYAATYLGPGSEEPLPVRVIDVLGRTGKRPSIAFFAAGLGVMFLMFAVTGRSAILLEERESGVLGRLLAARVGMTRVLLGRWLFLLLLGASQVLVMFLWAAVAFGLDLFTLRHLAGFGLTTLAVAAAAAAFGLILSAACRTRAQLNGVSVVVVLILSVLGGNLFPGFLMPAGLQSIGRLTFNSWALEAYRKVFWYESPVQELTPQIVALCSAALVFFALARWIARRWERIGEVPA